MDINKLGFEKYVEHFPELASALYANVARVAVEHRGGYLLYSFFGEIQGIIRRKLFYSTLPSDLPKVGDWVTIEKVEHEEKAVISSVLPRYAKIARSGVSDRGEQVIATNVDILFIVQSADTFNLRSLERYIAMARAGKATPVVILNKADLMPNAEEKAQEVRSVEKDCPVFCLSAKDGTGLEDLEKMLLPGLTIAFVGPSGVGKSTLINRLAGDERQRTQEVRAQDDKGRHTTTVRELIILPNGSLFIDTPGIRELGMAASESESASIETFTDIEELAARCVFRDCDHQKSQGCAVIAAVHARNLDEARHRNYLKLVSEGTMRKSREQRVAEMQKKLTYKKQEKQHKKRHSLSEELA